MRLPRRDLPAHEQTCAFFTQTCKWDCGFTSTRATLKKLEQHEQECPRRPLPCSNAAAGCLESGRGSHVCQYEEVPCTLAARAGCTARVLRKDLDAHERDECPKRRLMCPNKGCGAAPMCAEVLATHRASCAFEEVACAFMGTGCTATHHLRKDLDAHERRCQTRLCPSLTPYLAPI